MTRKFFGWDVKNCLLRLGEDEWENTYEWQRHWVFFFFWLIVFSRPCKSKPRKVRVLDARPAPKRITVRRRIRIIVPVLLAFFGAFLVGCAMSSRPPRAYDVQFNYVELRLMLEEGATFPVEMRDGTIIRVSRNDQADICPCGRDQPCIH